MRYILVFIGLIISSHLFCQVQDSTRLDFFGNMDTYWRYSFNQTTSVTSMEFDHNSFSMGWISLGVKREDKKTGFQGEVAFGPRSSQFFGGGNNPLGYIRDLSAYWNVTDKLKTTFGITLPFIGYEFDSPHFNLNYSGSYAYSYLPPPSLAGLQFEYQLDENWGLLAGLYNSSLTLIDDNEQKFIGAQVNYSNDNVRSVRLGVLTGKEADSSSVFILELASEIDLTEKIFLGSNILFQNQNFGNGNSKDWYMIVLYNGYRLKENLTLGLRAEYLGDPDAALLGVNENGIFSFTGTLSWQIKNLKISPEIRLENANQPTFLNDSQKLVNTEGHFLVAVMYEF